jgi:hypothetical protein
MLTLPAIGATALGFVYREELHFEIEPLVTAAVLLILNMMILEMVCFPSLYTACVAASAAGTASGSFTVALCLQGVWRSSQVPSALSGGSGLTL